MCLNSQPSHRRRESKSPLCLWPFPPSSRYLFVRIAEWTKQGTGTFLPRSPFAWRLRIFSGIVAPTLLPAQFSTQRIVGRGAARVHEERGPAERPSQRVREYAFGFGGTRPDAS